MDIESRTISGIPTLVWGSPGERAYLFVHGQCSRKEDAACFAAVATGKGYQVVSFDLPEHGERKAQPRRCTVQNGVEDLHAIIDFVRQNWRTVGLFANSLGAYFSLIAWRDIRFENCLLSSPILDMQRLIENMMRWAGVTPEELEARGEIPTDFGETLSWDHYRYVRENPVERWDSPTAILYPELDGLTERAVVEDFKQRFGAHVEVVKGSEHYLQSDTELAILDAWMRKHA